jgi:hypothetical protein
VTGTPPFPRSLSEVAIDALACVLFAGFVGILFYGYWEPQFSYTTLATLPLLGSLATLWWANLRADRIVRSRPATSIP